MSELFCRIAPGNRLDLFQEGETLLAVISEGVEYDLLFLDIIILEEGRDVLLSRNNLNAIHTVYAAMSLNSLHTATMKQA